MSSASALDRFDPRLAAWFRDTWPAPTDIQERAWPTIADGNHTLITAPTGSGKTLTAFLWSLNQLLTGTWEAGRTRVLYLSPLKALNNDIRRNLLDPLAALQTRLPDAPPLHVRTRSGDTPQSERRRMLREPPEILITTPESLNLLLSSHGGLSLLQSLETVILDEVHAVYGSKRGVHMMTAVERLTRLSGDFQRIALSATVNPLPDVAAFVGGQDPDGRPRPVEIIQSPGDKTYALGVRWLEPDRHKTEQDAAWFPITDEIRATAQRNTSTLVFANSRRLVEKLTYLVNRDQPEPLAFAHHGSLSREIRHDVESRLKAGRLKAIIATSSLELGIDIGALDEVILIQPPPSIAASIQRLGRAGHQVGAISRGRLFPLAPRELIEALVLTRGIDTRDLEPARPLDNPLDVLAQTIQSILATEILSPDEVYAIVRLSHPYRALPRKLFDLTLDMLAGRYEGTRIRELQPQLSWDRTDNTLELRKGARLRLWRAGGVIPNRGYFQLRHHDTNARIGELDEEFVWEARIGHSFTIGTQAWKIQRITHNDVFVTPAPTNVAAPPFWIAEQSLRDHHFATRIATWLEAADHATHDDAFWDDQPELDPPARDKLRDFLARQRAHTRSPLPHRHHLLVECVGSSARGAPGCQIVIHTLWGGRVNHPFALAIEAAWHDTFGGEVKTYSSDYSISLLMAEPVDVETLLRCVQPDTLETALRQRLESSGYFGARFREAAGIAMLLPEKLNGDRLPLWVTRQRSQHLLTSVRPHEDFPILLEAWRACLAEAFDLPALRDRLRDIDQGVIRVTTCEVDTPSPFANADAWRQINEAMYADDVPTGTHPSALSDELIRTILDDPEQRPTFSPDLVHTFETRRQRLAPGYAPDAPRDLLDWLVERLAIPHSEWQELLRAIARDHEDPTPWLAELAGKIVLDHPTLIFATEEAHRVRTPDAEALEQWLSFYGPIPVSTLTTLWPDPTLPWRDTDSRLGRFTDGLDDEQRCDRRNLESLLRLRRHQARPRITARPINDLPLFLAHHQGLTDRSPGPDAVQNALEQLTLLPGPAALWESDWLPARVAAYRPHDLDHTLQDEHLHWRGAGESAIHWVFDSDLDFLPDPDTPAETPLLPDPQAHYPFEAIRKQLGLNSSQTWDALWSAAWRGELACVGFRPLRDAIDTRFAYPTAATTPGTGRRRSRRLQRPLLHTGTWHTLPPPPPPEDHLDTLERLRERARLLLDRYGILFRELLHREPFAWRDIFRALRLMELGGEVVSGHLFEEIPGPQFLFSSRVDSLAPLAESPIFWIHAQDPVSPCGLPIPALKSQFPKRLATTHLAFRGSDCLLVSERNGKQLTIRVPPDDPDLPALLEPLAHLLEREVRPLAKLIVESINNEDPNHSPFRPLLETRFRLIPDYRKMTLFRSS